MDDAPFGAGRVPFVGSNGAIMTAPVAAHKPVKVAPAPVKAPVKAPKPAPARPLPTAQTIRVVSASASASRKLSKTGVAVAGFSQKVHLKEGKLGEETFHRHPTDPNKIIAKYRVKKPDGTYYTQTNELREIDTSKTPKTPAESILEPQLDHHKVPRRVRASKKNGGAPILFVKDPKSNAWTRPAGDHGPALRWTPCILFRRLDSETGEYLQPYVNVDRLQDVDPNDKAWAYACKYHLCPDTSIH